MESNGNFKVNLIFTEDSPPSDPKVQPVLIVGQVANLNKVKYDQVKHKLQPRVSEEVYLSALQSFHPNTSETVPLYLKSATLGSLPGRCSRHNSPARPHSLSSLVKSVTSGISETIVVICPYEDVLASASAIARSYPTFSLKSKPQASNGNIIDEVTVHIEFIIIDSKVSGMKPDMLVLNAIAEGVRLAAAIVDKPTNLMNVTQFLLEIENVSITHKMEFEVIRGEALKKNGLGGIYGVGKASTDPPALAILSYVPSGEPETTIAWVGKGIVYDTGGLSIKGKTTMPGMKRDCGGAAAILGAMLVAAQVGSKAAIHAIFCLAENSVGPNATRPDDIHVLLSGRTVEINNTDAEGRLVLADGVVFAAKNFNPQVIIDVATLTGAQGIATGKYHGGILTNSEAWEKKAVTLSLISGDLLFPLVFSPELHFSEYNSSVADMKNSVTDRANAQPSCAGLFILSHLGFDTPCDWVHIDMASPVHQGERATGYGVTLLTLLVAKHSKNQMLQTIAAI